LAAGAPYRLPFLVAAGTVAVALAIIPLIPPESVGAQADGGVPDRRELEGLLRKRDLVVEDLLRRVEELERKLSSLAAPTPTVTPPDLPAARTAAAPPSPQPSRRQAEAASTRAEPEPAQAPVEPGQVVVDEKAAQRALERTLVQTGVLLLPPGQAEITPSFAYTRSEQEAAVALPSDGTTIVGNQSLRRDIWDADLGLRFGLPYDSQLELGLPYSFVDQSTVANSGFTAIGEQNDSGSGWGDLTLGLAKTLAREEGWRPDLIGRVTWDTGTGERFDDDVFLGGGRPALTFQLNATKRQDPLVFAGALGYTKAFEKDRFRSGDEVGYALTAFLAASPETSLRFGLSQSFVDEAEFQGNRLRGSDFVSATLNLGASTILGVRTLLDVGAEIGLTDESPDFTVQVSLPIRFDLPLGD
jgi:Putative MetA-pathway of phenol degradation